MKLISILTGVIRVKLAPVKAKVKKWTSLTYLLNSLFIKIRELFGRVFDIAPKDSKDYYCIGAWMVSKKLAFAAVILTGILCVCYLAAMLPSGLFQNQAGCKTFRYNAVPLKFYDGKVEITGKSGYTAYIGTVKDGAVQGTGTLYRKNKETVYTGQFENNRFHGTGSLYYDGNLLQYTGDFQNNEFEGEGTLYRRSGVKKYEGGFHQGKMEGEGKLYNASEQLIYEGSFQDDTIVYEELAGIKTKEAAEKYKGKKTVYSNEKETSVVLEEIGAVYYLENSEQALEEDWTAGGIYVLSETARIEGKRFMSGEELYQEFGLPEYEGYTKLRLSDAVAFNQLSGAEGEVVVMETEEELKDVVDVLDYDKDYLVYLYLYKREGFQYTFFCRDKGAGFSMYLIERTD